MGRKTSTDPGRLDVENQGSELSEMVNKLGVSVGVLVGDSLGGLEG